MLMLGISIGVAFNVVFLDWMLTTLLIIVFIGISASAFFKGVDTWKKETLTKKEARQNSQLSNVGRTDDAAQDLQTGDQNPTETNQSEKKVVSVLENVCWKELGLLLSVWIMILALEIGKVRI